MSAAAARTGVEGEELFRFEGDFAEVAIDWLTGEVRQRMESAPVAVKARARLFASFVEMTQNILHYAEPAARQGGPRRAGAIAFGRSGQGYWIRSQNPVREAHAARLKARLEDIRAMGPDQITAAYRQRLAADRAQGADPLSRGAGLGLLAIARSTGGALDFQLESAAPGGGEPYTFSLHATLRTATGESA